MRRAFLCVAALAACGSASFAAKPSFQSFGSIPGNNGFLWPRAMSADGTVVVGLTTSGDPFRWTRENGLQPIVVPGADIYSVTDVSPDGSTIFGSLSVPSLGGAYFQQTDGHDVVYPLGPPAYPYAGGNIVASADARTLAFTSGLTQGQEAVVWTPENGINHVGDFPGGEFDSRPTDISDDGQTIVGVGKDALGIRAFRWTATGGLRDLVDGQNNYFAPNANAISADGSVIVGSAATEQSRDHWFPMRWTPERGIELLAELGESPLGGSAVDVSADGSVIVGNNSEYGAFLWTEPHGAMPLMDLLTTRYQLGDSLAGWQLTTVALISDNGSTMAGMGVNPAGKSASWIATVPEPSSEWLALGGIAALAFARRRRVAR